MTASPPHMARVCKATTTCHHAAACGDVQAAGDAMATGSVAASPAPDDELQEVRAELAEARAQLSRLLAYMPRCFQSSANDAEPVEPISFWSA